MLGFVAENYPQTGALGLAIMGGAGMLSVSLVLPVIGGWYDAGIVERMPAGAVPTPEVLATIKSAAGLEALGKSGVAAGRADPGLRGHRNRAPSKSASCNTRSPVSCRFCSKTN